MDGCILHGEWRSTALGTVLLDILNDIFIYQVLSVFIWCLGALAVRLPRSPRDRDLDASFQSINRGHPRRSTASLCFSLGSPCSSVHCFSACLGPFPFASLHPPSLKSESQGGPSAETKWWLICRIWHCCIRLRVQVCQQHSLSVRKTSIH